MLEERYISVGQDTHRYSFICWNNKPRFVRGKSSIDIWNHEISTRLKKKKIYQVNEITHPVFLEQNYYKIHFLIQFFSWSQTCKFNSSTSVIVVKLVIWLLLWFCILCSIHPSSDNHLFSIRVGGGGGLEPIPVEVVDVGGGWGGGSIASPVVTVM